MQHFTKSISAPSVAKRAKQPSEVANSPSVDPTKIVISALASHPNPQGTGAIDETSSLPANSHRAGVDEGSKTVGQTGLGLTNAAFLAAIFSHIPDGAQPLVTGKSGDPQAGNWTASAGDQIEVVCPSHRNTYFNCASFKPDEDGTVTARKASAVAYHCLVLDDVGTKVSRILLGTITPTWELETSPGNFQIGFKLNPPLYDTVAVDQLLQVISEAGLTDKGAKGMNRWVRLPSGINGKPKYSVNGKPFVCRLHVWNPETVYSATELLSALPVQVTKVMPSPVCAKSPRQTTTDTATLSKLLEALDPDCGYQDWLSALMAIYHETGGSEAGMELADAWSRKGKSYKGRTDIETKWRSFTDKVHKPVTVATLVARARDTGADVAAIMGDKFQPCKTEVIVPAEARQSCAKASPLRKYSLIGQAAKYMEQAQGATPLLGDVCMAGEATVWYAKHNAGKTLLTLHLLTEAIGSGRIAAGHVYLVNADDSSSGLAEKLGILDELGGHTLVPGQAGFKAENLQELLTQAAREGTASGTLVIIDTLKKFTDLMNKRAASEFANSCRQFVAAGGSLVGLAHTNKRKGDDGKPIHAGTSDILDDFDAGYIIDEMPLTGKSGEKIVQFDRLKGRGGGVQAAAFAYAAEDGLSYAERLASVRAVDPDDLESIRQVEAVRSDAEVIAAVTCCIGEGINTKMALRDAAAKRANVSRRAAVMVLERYTGDDPSRHRWSFVRKARGAMIFQLLVAGASAPIG